MNKTPVMDTELKTRVMKHMIDEHQKELLAIARAYIDPAIDEAAFVDLFEEGMLLRTSSVDRQEDHFVPFVTKGSFHEKIRHIAMTAVKRLG
ncbi:DUF2470 domain-containing protein [Pasteurellaceae bacterium LIM206]|nr:DUF2470 domain-containing protein [Pasteurellaceae bacterium LIM206]